MRCTLNGIHCDAGGSVGWVFTTGFEPHVQAFEMDRNEAAQFLNEGGPVTLVIEDNNRSMVVEGLEVVGEGPASRDVFRTVLIADLRWKWSRKLVTGQYNTRRRSGQKHLAGSALIQIAQVIDNYEFAPASLKGEVTKWTPREMIEDVLKKLGEGDEFEFEYEIEDNTEQLEVNDVDINDSGPEALRLALQHLPGSTVWVDREGKVRIQSAIDLKEAEVLGKMGPDIVDEGHTSKVRYRFTRPRLCRVHFVREQEIRHNTVVGEVTADARYMTNVALVTDPEILIAGNIVMFGSWAAFDALFTPWNTSLPGADEGFTVPPPISHTVIQQAFFEDALFRLYVPFGSDIPQPIWAGRVNAIKAHYRQTYQINRRWVDRSRKVMAVRSALLDPTTGTRGRSQAHGDFCVKVAAMPANIKANQGRLWFNSYGGDEAGSTPFLITTPLGDSNVVPAIVTMLDDQAGVLHLDYKVDPYGAWKQIYPSAVDNLPSAVMNDKLAKGANMKIGETGLFPQLTANDAKSVVLTHVPAFPNSNKQFYCIEVDPGDVSGLVKGLVIDPAEGPPWDLFVDPGQVTARMAWLDEFAGVIEKSMGVNVGNGGPADSAQEREILRSLLVNEEDLLAVAHTMAATVWSKLTDRYIGSKSVRMDPRVAIAGSIESVSHMGDVEGAVVTHVSLPEEFASRDFRALLPPGTRKIIFREVLP